MIPADVPIEIMQGDRHDIYFRAQQEVWDDVNLVWTPGAYIDLTGKTIKAQIRASVDGPVVAEFHCEVVLPQTDPNIVGSGYAYLLPSETAALTQKNYVWDLEVRTDVDHIDTWFGGAVTVKFEVTRDGA